MLDDRDVPTRIAAICVGAPSVLPGKTAPTGILKHGMTGPVIVDAAGLAGDAICNRKYHGGPDQAVYGLGTLDLDGWAEALGRPIAPGTFGENVVMSGIDSRTVAVGDRFETQSVTLEVTSTRIPCSTLSLRMNDPGFARRFLTVARPGFYCRVLRAGLLEVGEPVVHRLYGGARITMPEMLALSAKHLSAQARARILAAPISIRVRAQIEKAHP